MAKQQLGTNPTWPHDAATKEYVDGAILADPVKQAVKVMTTGNITPATRGLGLFNAVTLVDGDRVLLIGQTNATENGIYITHSPTQTYTLSAWAKSGDLGGANYTAADTQYFGLAGFDADGLQILVRFTNKYFDSTDTTLTVALKPGDTTMTVASAVGWAQSPGSYNTNIIWWPYVNSKGYSYPAYTYSRNSSGSIGNNYSLGLWTVAPVGNVFTLRVPWAGPLLPVGTPVRNTTDGGNNYICIANQPIPNVWTFYSASIGGLEVNGINDSFKFHPGTAYIKLFFIVNVQGVANNSVRYNLINFAQISMDSVTKTYIDAADALAVHKAGTETITGAKTFSSAVTLQSDLVVAGTTSLGGWVDERTFAGTFPHGVANQKFDLYFPAFWGQLEVTLASAFSNVNAGGSVKKTFFLALNPANASYANVSRYSESSGPISTHFAISDATWDATNSRWRIQIVHRTSNGNPVWLDVKGIASGNGFSLTVFGVSAVYTTDATVFPTPVVSTTDALTVGGVLTASAGAAMNAQKITGLANGTAATDAAAFGQIPTTALHTFISDFDTGVRTSTLNQMAAPTTDVAWGNNKITGLAEPTLAQDAATKNYVDVVDDVGECLFWMTA